MKHRSLGLLALALFSFGTFATQPLATNYPAHWWKEVPKIGAPEWEVLPQEAKPGEVILSKRHELGLLSNFAPTPFVFRGVRYASLEGFWQMMMYPEDFVYDEKGKQLPDPRKKAPGIKWKHTREQVAQMSSFKAKKAGDLAWDNMKALKINWVSFEGKKLEYWTAEKGPHYKLIVEATRAKVEQNKDVRDALLATGDLILKPDHHQPDDAPPSWHYCEILTELRAKFQALQKSNGLNNHHKPQAAGSTN